MSAPVGRSLALGLNEVDPLVYGDRCRLYGCRGDSVDVTAYLNTQGFRQSTILNDGDAVEDALRFYMAYYAKLSLPGDLFVLVYSGHGTQVPDEDGDERDAYDEALCLFDGLFPDDELRGLLAAFAPGVRVVYLSDSCHSGTQQRLIPSAPPLATGRRPKALPLGAQIEATDRYRKGLEAKPRQKTCQDTETASDGDENGAFTEALLASLEDARTWYTLRDRVRAKTAPLRQSPKLTLLGLPRNAIPFEV
jgi:hypothetical protein